MLGENNAVVAQDFYGRFMQKNMVIKMGIADMHRLTIFDEKNVFLWKVGE